MSNAKTQKRISRNCPQCGKLYSFYPSATKTGIKKYCSLECQKKGTHIEKQCPECGKTFLSLKSWPTNHCSRKCSSKSTVHVHFNSQPIGKKFCEICGKEIKKGKWSGVRFCSQKCFGIHLTKTRTGVPRPEVSGPQPQRYKRVSKTCPQCEKEFQVKQSQAARRRFCSKACMANFQVGSVSGENNFNWRGGYDPYYGPNWRQQRRNARRRDNYTCQRCGIDENKLKKQLDVHHIRPFRLFKKDYKRANRLSNLVSLCPVCHLVTEHTPKPPT